MGQQARLSNDSESDARLWVELKQTAEAGEKMTTRDLGSKINLLQMVDAGPGNLVVGIGCRAHTPLKIVLPLLEPRGVQTSRTMPECGS